MIALSFEARTSGIEERIMKSYRIPILLKYNPKNTNIMGRKITKSFKYWINLIHPLKVSTYRKPTFTLNFCDFLNIIFSDFTLMNNNSICHKWMNGLIILFSDCFWWSEIWNFSSFLFDLRLLKKNYFAGTTTPSKLLLSFIFTNISWSVSAARPCNTNL